MSASLWRRLLGRRERANVDAFVLEEQTHADETEEEHLKSSITAAIEKSVQNLPETMQDQARIRATWKDAIQPHTDEGGDAHYIGDAYGEIDADCVRDWSTGVNLGLYLKYIQDISKTHKHLEYLYHWMLVSCAPPKWRFLEHTPKSREERVKRTNVCVIDYKTGRLPVSTNFKDSSKLQDFLKTLEGTSTKPDARLVIVEDLSRDVIEVLGTRYDIDPCFFRSHISDYLYNATRDRWAELPTLDIDNRKRNYFTLSYLRPSYFRSGADFQEAERQSGMFNVLRRLDSDRSRNMSPMGLLNDPTDASVTLARAKTSFWAQHAKPHEPITAVLLVDPTVSHGMPLWKSASRPFEDVPSMESWKNGQSPRLEAVTRGSLFEDVVYYCCLLGDAELINIRRDPRSLLLPMLKLVVGDWLVVLKYMTTVFAQVEWSLTKPHWASAQEINQVLQKVLPWRRNLGHYSSIVTESMRHLFPRIATTDPVSLIMNTPCEGGILDFLSDFRNIKQQLDERKEHMSSLHVVATNLVDAVTNEESRRAAEQSKNLARLTFLATFFIPLSFTTSFLSMSPDFSNAEQTIWLFFVLGIPITVVAFLLVDWIKPGDRGFTKRLWQKLFPAKAKKI